MRKQPGRIMNCVAHCIVLVGMLAFAPSTLGQDDDLSDELAARAQFEIDSQEFSFYDDTFDRTIQVLVRYPIDAPEPLPVVLWSHGGPPDRRGTRHLTTGEAFGSSLARAGYVVVHLNHAPVDRPGLLCIAYDLAARQCLGRDFDPLTLMRLMRPQDASIVVDNLISQADALPVVIDTGRFALAGQSFGAYTTMVAAGAVPVFDVVRNPFPIIEADPRICAFVAVSPQGPGRFGFTDESWDGIERPVLVITGAGDDFAGEESQNRVVPFYSMPPGEKYLAYVDDPAYGHLDYAFLEPSPLTTAATLVSLAFLDRQFGIDGGLERFLDPETLAAATAGFITLEARPTTADRPADAPPAGCEVE